MGNLLGSILTKRGKDLIDLNLPSAVYAKTMATSAGENSLVTVFRSADIHAEEQANAVRDMLVEADIRAKLFDDHQPGVPEGAFEVRVPPEQSADAEELIRTQGDFIGEPVDASHDLDMATVFESDAYNAEMVALEVRSILEAHRIPSVLVSGSLFPNFPFAIRVPHDRLDEARRAIAAAEEAGPSAAEEGELESERPPGNPEGSA
jgi:hypothetical protein